MQVGKGFLRSAFGHGWTLFARPVLHACCTRRPALPTTCGTISITTKNKAPATASTVPGCGPTNQESNMRQHTHAPRQGGIRRGPRRADNFSIISNAVLDDDRLSYRARGILLYLLAKPADWRARSESIAAQSPREGRDAVRTAMRELEEYGYIVRERFQDSLGRWRTLQTVYEIPADAHVVPGPGKPDLGAADVGQPVATQRIDLPRTNTNPPTPTKPARPAAARRTSPARVGGCVTTLDPQIRALADACRLRGLSARWDRLSPEQETMIGALLEAHGVAALATAAERAHRPSDPTRYAQGYLGAWTAMAPPRPAAAPARPSCGACDEYGWLPDDDQDRAVRCACRAVAAAAA